MLAATLVVAAGTGCSGDERDDTATTTTGSMVQPGTTEDTAARPEPPEDQTRWATQVDEAAKPPAKKSEAERAALFVAGMQKIEQGLTRYRAAIRAGDGEAAGQALAEANAAGTDTRSAAISVGITECGGYSGG